MEVMHQKIFPLILFFIIASNCVGQTSTIVWKDDSLYKGQKFPVAFINGTTAIEQTINNYLRNKYLNQSESYRDSFYEYGVHYPVPEICGLILHYEHEFNTSPGLWSFIDHNFFDTRNGNIIRVKSLFNEESFNVFLKLINERKNLFVEEFRQTISDEEEDSDRLHKICKYTIEQELTSADIEHSDDPDAMSSGYKMLLYEDHLLLKYNWEYGWGIGRQTLPDIILKFTYAELTPLFSDYAKALFRIAPQRKGKRK